MTRTCGLLLCAMLVAFVSPARAEIEDGLYGAAVPNDALFVRRIGIVDASVDLFGRSFSAGELPEETYVAISAAQLDGAQAGGHYTILSDGAAPFILQEPVRTEPSKVHLFLLNAGSASARLVVADGGPVVIDTTTDGQISQRAVNPVSVTLTVEANGLSENFDLVLRRGVNLTFLVADGDVRLIENRYGPVIEAR